MVGADEIILTGQYKDFRSDIKYDLSGANESEVSSILGSLSDTIEVFAFKFSEINLGAIERYAKIDGTGLQAVINFLESHPQGELKAELRKAIPVPELMPAAESYFFNVLMKSAKISFRVGNSMYINSKSYGQLEVEDHSMYVNSTNLRTAVTKGHLISVPSLKPSKEAVDNQIFFVGKFGSWIVIKKLTLDAVKDWEVSGILCSINNTIVNKAFDFSKVERNDTLISKLCSGKRKSYGNLLAVLKQIQNELSGDRLKDAYLVCSVFCTLGYCPYANPEMLTAAHPEIRAPKIKGRKPKG
jgi:hypothetical protein